MLSPRGRKARNPSKAKGGLYLQSWATRDARGGPCQATAILSPPDATATLSPLIRVLVPPVWKEVPCGSSIHPAAGGIWIRAKTEVQERFDGALRFHHPDHGSLRTTRLED